jgi:hypothetical protein
MFKSGNFNNYNSLFNINAISTKSNINEKINFDIKKEINIINDKINIILKTINNIDDIDNINCKKLLTKIDKLHGKITMLIEQEKNNKECIIKQQKLIKSETFKNKYRIFICNKCIYNDIKKNNSEIPLDFNYIYSIYEKLYKLINYEKIDNECFDIIDIDKLNENQILEFNKFIELFNENISNLTGENLFTALIEENVNYND